MTSRKIITVTRAYIERFVSLGQAKHVGFTTDTKRIFAKHFKEGTSGSMYVVRKPRKNLNYEPSFMYMIPK